LKSLVQCRSRSCRCSHCVRSGDSDPGQNFASPPSRLLRAFDR
jgi:hypothetical protein